jgi:hypothetical protein
VGVEKSSPEAVSEDPKGSSEEFVSGAAVLLFIAALLASPDPPLEESLMD